MGIEKKSTERLGYDREESYFNRQNREAIEKLKRKRALEEELDRRREAEKRLKAARPKPGG